MYVWIKIIFYLEEPFKVTLFFFDTIIMHTAVGRKISCSDMFLPLCRKVS